MEKVEIALNTLTQITDSEVVESKEYENAINSLCELKHRCNIMEDKKEPINYTSTTTYNKSID